MTVPTPYEAAVAIARAHQTDPAFARTLACEYAADGVDPLRIAYAATRLLAQADRRLAALSGREVGDWLAHMGGVVASSERPPLHG